MVTGEHDWPEEFRDEDKWLYLTKRQWLIIAVFALLGGGVVALFAALRLYAVMGVSFVICALFLIAGVLVAFFPMPDRLYLFGGGERLEVLLFRLLKKRQKSARVIWTANYENDADKWGEGAARVRRERERNRSSKPHAGGTKLPWA